MTPLDGQFILNDMRRTFLILAILILTSGVALGTVVRELALSDMVQQAKKICLVNVGPTASSWTAARRYIVTDATVTVVQDIHNCAEKELKVRRLGGSVEGQGMKVFGAAVLNTGQRALLYLAERQNALWVVGMAQGRVFVERDGEGNEIVQPRNLSGLALANEKEGRLTLNGHAEHEQGRTTQALTGTDDAPKGQRLSDYIRSIKQALETCRKSGKCPQR